MNRVARAHARRKGRRIAAKHIAAFEGGASPDGKYRPYWDAAGGVWTQGAGHTAGVGAHSPAWSHRKALRVLRHDLKRTYGPPLDRLGLPLTAHMHAAILSSVYNLGPGVLDRGRSLGDALRAHHWQHAADALLLYVHAADGELLEGLQVRRRAERAEFLRGLKAKRR